MAAQLLAAKDLYKEYNSGGGRCIAVNHVNLMWKKAILFPLSERPIRGKAVFCIYFPAWRKNQPKIIFLDEPTGSLNTAARASKVLMIKDGRIQNKLL